MGKMPFALTYELEVVVSVEVGMPTYRIQHFDQGSSSERLKEELDLLEAKVRIEVNKRRVERYFNQRVQLRFFKLGDVVLRQVGITT